MSLLWSLYLGVLPLICGDTSFVRCQHSSQHTTGQKTVTTESSNDDTMSTVLIVLYVWPVKQRWPLNRGLNPSYKYLVLIFLQILIVYTALS